MPIEREPRNPLPANYVPPSARPYRVIDGDSWESLAKLLQVEPADLIDFNFATTNPDEVNWYLNVNVGCNKATPDGKNWMFSLSATPGIVYLPSRTSPFEPLVGHFRKCREDLAEARATLSRSAEVSQSLSNGLAFWFARLYQYITLFEIEARGTLQYPCFLLHFIPVFYGTYLRAVEAFLRKESVPAHWRTHFNLSNVPTDPTQPIPYARVVTNCTILGVEAHVKGDMKDSLVKAYHSFCSRYDLTLNLDSFSQDFFENNISVFERARNRLMFDIANLLNPYGMPGQRITTPAGAEKIQDMLRLGLDLKTVFAWRRTAWVEAKRTLGQP